MNCLNGCRQRTFFTAPASTKYHGAYPGGLLDHILDVYYRMFPEAQQAGYDAETIAVVALLHDICKLNVYKETEWEGKILYKYHDDFPLGTMGKVRGADFEIHGTDRGRNAGN